MNAGNSEERKLKRLPKGPEGKAKSVQSMYQIPVTEQPPQQGLRRASTAPSSYFNQSFVGDPNAVYGQQPAMYPPPYYTGGYPALGSPVYYPPVQQPTVIIRQNQRVLSPGYSGYDNNETFEGYFGPDVPRTHQFVNNNPASHQQEQLDTCGRNRIQHSYRSRPEISVAEARALEEAIQLSLTESSRRASQPSHPEHRSLSTEDFESGFTSMAATSHDGAVSDTSEAMADEKALQAAILLSLADSPAQFRSNKSRSYSSEMDYAAMVDTPPLTARTDRQYPYNLTPELRKKSSFRTSFEQSTAHRVEQERPAPQQRIEHRSEHRSEEHAQYYAQDNYRGGREEERERNANHYHDNQQSAHQSRAYEEKKHRHLSMEVVVPPGALYEEERRHAGKQQSSYRARDEWEQHAPAQLSPRERDHIRARGGREHRSDYEPQYSPRSEERPAFAYHPSDPRSRQQQQPQPQVVEHRSSSAPRGRAEGRREESRRETTETRGIVHRGRSSSPPKSRDDGYREDSHRQPDYHRAPPQDSLQHRPLPPPPPPLRKDLSSSTVQYESYTSASEFEGKSRGKSAYNGDHRPDHSLRRPDSTATMVRPAPAVLPQRDYSSSTMHYDEDYNSASEEEAKPQPQPRVATKVPPVNIPAQQASPYKRTDLNAAVMRPPPPYVPQREYSNTTVQYDASYASGSEYEEPYEDIRKQSSRRNSPREDGASGLAAPTLASSYLSPRRAEGTELDDPLSTRRVYPDYHKSYSSYAAHSPPEGMHAPHRAHPAARTLYE